MRVWSGVMKCGLIPQQYTLPVAEQYNLPRVLASVCVQSVSPSLCAFLSDSCLPLPSHDGPMGHASYLRQPGVGTFEGG